MSWITPIYDRTNNDVEAAKAQISLWLEDPSVAVVTDLKGCLNPSDLNRIEGNMEWLDIELAALGYLIPAFTVKTDWAYSDYSDLTQQWKENHIDRIIQNLSILVASIPQGYITEIFPNNMLTFEQINAIENIQYQIHQFVINYSSSFRYSGSVLSGDWAV